MLRWLAASGILYAFSTFSGPLWVAQKKIAESILFSIAMCLTVITAITAGVRAGAEGISLALFVRSVVVFPVFVYVNYRLTGIAAGDYYRALMPALLAGAFMAAVLYAIQRFYSRSRTPPQYPGARCGVALRRCRVRRGAVFFSSGTH